jgi:hypothetical protein
MRGVQSKHVSYSGRPPINMRQHQTLNLQLSQMYFRLQPSPHYLLTMQRAYQPAGIHKRKHGFR